MALMLGMRLGPYEIAAPIGAGGMGEVYRALDTHLGRQVAIKILPDIFAHDSERLARFEREAKTLAALNHPNIAQIYGLEKSDGSTALVMELVEGPPLADRIAQGPIPIDEVLAIAKQMAEALEAAHEQGIVHRDLKPANIKVKDSGTVKVLDFGLAKAVEPAGAMSAALSQSPTITSPAMTQAGIILGTAAYMSPEQARGKSVDKRTDIWAFGCVLYEMLTGKRAFEGEDVGDTLASVLRADPDWNALPANLPTPIRTLLEGCLVKDRRHRVADISTVLFVLDNTTRLASVPASVDGAAVDARLENAIATTRRELIRRGRLRVVATGLAALVVGVGITGVIMWSGTRAVAPAVSRFPIVLGADESFTNTSRQVVALSPDGRRFVYVANQRLYLRALDQLAATPLIPPETGGVTSPFFSPDGQWVGFWAAGQLKKVGVGGGAPIALCAADSPWSASWDRDDTIFFGQGPKGIWKVSSTGGAPERVVAMKEGELAHGPQLLPGGQWLLFTVSSNFVSWNDAQIVAQALATGERRMLIDGGRDAHYLSSGHLVYGRARNILAVPFDLRSLRVTGGAVSVLEGVGDGGQTGTGVATTGAVHLAISRTGSLIYRPEGVGATVATLAWVDRQGHEEPLGVPMRSYDGPRLSPDGTRVAVRVMDGDDDIWVYSLSRGTLDRLTFERGHEIEPVWTTDGARLTYFSGAGSGIFWRPADGTGAAERLTTGNHRPHSWSPDGQRLVFVDVEGAIAKTGSIDLAVTTLHDKKVEPLVWTAATEANAYVSPDGRWLAYRTNETGQMEVFVRPFPDVQSGRWRISTDGGGAPLWAPDSRTLFYQRGQAMMAVSVRPGPPSGWSTPQKLFEGSYNATVPPRQFDISLDGKRFLMLKPARSTASGPPLVFVENWIEELKRLVPTP